MDHRKRALLFGLAAVGVWSTVASAFKLSLRHLDPLQLLLLACVFSLIALFGTLVFQDKTPLLKTVSHREAILCGLLGALNPFLYYVILFKAYDLLPAQEAQPLNYTWAITLTLLSVPLLGQKLRGRDLIALCVSYVGVLVISTQGNLLDMRFTNVTGVTLALGSTVIWALYWIYNTRSKLDPMVGLFLNFAWGTPMVLIAVLFFSEFPRLTLNGLLGAAYVGFFEMGITFALWLTALKHAAQPGGGGNARVANLIFLSPFLSLLFIHFLLGEDILPATVVGLGFIVAGNALMQSKNS